MPNSQHVLLYRNPDLQDTRGGSHLLVWGGLAQWLVVDDELAAFLALFDGQCTVADVVRLQSRQTGKPLSVVARETESVVGELRRRGILHDGASGRVIEPEPVRIANVTVNLTNRCNLRCRWCYNADRQTQEMPVQSMMDAIEQGRNILDPNASFIILGGEPFIDAPRLLAALDRAAGLFAPPAMVSTNGTLLTREAVAELTRRRVEVQVSLDSADAEEHDTIRGEGVFEKATTGISRLVNAGVHTIVSMVYTRPDACTLERYFDLALRLGVNEARLIPMRAIGRGLDCADALPDQAEVFEDLMDVLARRPDVRPLLGRDFFSILNAVCRHSTPRTGCGIGRKVLFIDADGLVYPCPNHTTPGHVCGDLRQDDIAAIARNSSVLNALRERYQVERYTSCGTCAFRYWCAGDCRGEVLAATGDPLGPSPHCEELRTVIKEMLWLAAENDGRLGGGSDQMGTTAPEDTFLT
jgi:radical SAM protein with 4Fe4S-binding SPASM domain